MATEKKFMLISIRDNKLKVKVDQYNPENNDAFQNTYMNDAPIHEELLNNSPIAKYRAYMWMGFTASQAAIRKSLTSMPVCAPTPRARSTWLYVSTPARIRMNGWNA